MACNNITDHPDSLCKCNQCKVGYYKNKNNVKKNNKPRPVRAIIKQNARNKKWYIHFRAANGEPLPDNYNRVESAIHGAELFNNGVRVIVVKPGIETKIRKVTVKWLKNVDIDKPSSSAKAVKLSRKRIAKEVKSIASAKKKSAKRKK